MVFRVDHFEEVHHRVAIAGKVTDAILTKQNVRDNFVPDAVVQIENRIVRGKPLQTVTHTDGSFVFIDLPVGQYFLKVSVPGAGSRYGTVTVEVTVSAQASDRPVPLDTKANVQLLPTHLTGLVKRSDNNQAIANASVQIIGSKTQTLTNRDGHYLLTGIQAGNPTVQVSADGFATAKQKVSLTVGQATNQDFSLSPN